MNIAEQMLDVLACVVRRLADSGARPSHILSVRIDLAEASGYEDRVHPGRCSRLQSLDHDAARSKGNLRFSWYAKLDLKGFQTFNV